MLGKGSLKDLELCEGGEDTEKPRELAFARWVSERRGLWGWGQMAGTIYQPKMVVPVPQLILNRIWEGIASVIGNKLPLN